MNDEEYDNPTEEDLIMAQCSADEGRAMAGWLGRKNPGESLDFVDDWN